MPIPRQLSALAGELRKFFHYGLAGLAATATHYVTMVVLVGLLDGREVVASSLGFIAGALVKYPLNYWMVFRSSQRHLVAVPRFVLGLALGFVLNAAVLAALLHSVEVHYMILQVVTTGFVLLVNYLVARLWIFTHPAQDRGGPPR